jgi:hypothetical protein
MTAPAATHTHTPPCRHAPGPPPQPTTPDHKDNPPNHAHARRDRSPSPALSKDNAEKLAALVSVLAAKHR